MADFIDVYRFKLSLTRAQEEMTPSGAETASVWSFVPSSRGNWALPTVCHRRQRPFMIGLWNATHGWLLPIPASVVAARRSVPRL